MNPMKPMNSMSRLLCLMVVLLAGCAAGAPQASGPYRVLNPGRWQPTPEDLRGDRASPSPPSSASPVAHALGIRP